MNKEVEVIFIFSFFIFIISIIPLGNADVPNNSSLAISANISVPIAKVSISPSSINLGEITKGYATKPKNINVTNIGDLDVKVNPVLDGSANNFFNYLEFNTGTCTSGATWHNISYYNKNNLTSTLTHASNYSLGGGGQDNFCIRLDLTDYSDEIITNSNLMTNLTFWVMPA